MVAIENASVHFQLPVLEDLQLTIEPKETFGIIGAGGCGKSVLLKVIAQLIRLEKGSCELGTDRYTMTFQRSGLFDSLTAEENLDFVLYEARVPRRERLERIDAALEEVGLRSQGKLYPHELSGGMQKRLGIARALLLRPELVLYDDPTAGLDPVTSRTITNLIQEMKEKYGMTIVLTTSDLKVAFNLSTRIGFLHSGKFAEVGEPSAIKGTSNPIVRQFLHGDRT